MTFEEYYKQRARVIDIFSNFRDEVAKEGKEISSKMRFSDRFLFEMIMNGINTTIELLEHSKFNEGDVYDERN